MFRATRFARATTEEHGFSLIELMVVVIILGVLAAIAVPAFLEQQTRAADVAAKSSLREAAIAQESYQIDKETYTDNLTKLEVQGFDVSGGVTFKPDIKPASANSYCMSAKHYNSTTTWYVGADSGSAKDSLAAACP